MFTGLYITYSDVCVNGVCIVCGEYRLLESRDLHFGELCAVYILIAVFE